MTVALLWLGAIVTRAAGPYYVATNGDETSNGLSWAAAVLTISNGVAKATADDTVWVSNGTYYLTDQIMITNKITVQSMNGWTNTLVGYAGDSHTTRCFYVARTSVLYGFSISNGHYIGSNTYNGGGGAWVGTGTIQNCYFVNNICSNRAITYVGGGGVYIQNQGIVSNCTFYTNTAYGVADNYGGAAFVYGLVVDCTAISNYMVSQRAGGGIAVLGSGIASNCFCAYNNSYGMYGAGDSQITDCVMSNNSVGVLIDGGKFMKNCLIINNSGRGVENWYAGAMTNCVIVGNRGGGIAARTDTWNGKSHYLAVDRCVISNNIISSGTDGGAGYRVKQSGILRNCLIHHNSNTSASAYGGGVLVITGALYTTAESGALTNGIFNCTIADNYSATEGGGLAAIGTNYIVNCVIASNRTAAAGSSYSNVYNIAVLISRKPVVAEHSAVSLLFHEMGH